MPSDFNESVQGLHRLNISLIPQKISQAAGVCLHASKRTDPSGAERPRCEPTLVSLLLTVNPFLTIVSSSASSPLKAVLRYLRSDKRMSSVTFNNLVLADGQQHRLLFHLKGMRQQGPSGVELHLDCRLVETVRDLPAAFQGLPPGYGMVELKTMHARDQVTRQSIITARVCVTIMDRKMA